MSLAGAVLASAAAGTLLAGCGSGSLLVDTVRTVIGPAAADNAVLNPDLRYLRVTAGKNVALLVLGYTDPAPRADTQVWYSADKETIRLWRGRLAGTAGLKTDWRSVSFGEVPGWRAAEARGGSYRRQRDVMPGYETAVRDEVRIVPVVAPADTRLVGIDPRSLRWFEERTTPEGQAARLPVARFAVDLSGGQERVVYSEQCLSATLCLTLQAWPARPPAEPGRPAAAAGAGNPPAMPGPPGPAGTGALPAAPPAT